MSWRRWIRNNIVMLVAFVAAAVTCFFVPFDREYFGYFDCKTLTCLFCTLAVVCALKNIHFFQTVAKKIVCMFKTARSAILVLIYITFIGSMLIANDMALLTFLPLGYFVLDSTGNKKLLSFTFIMQTVAANLGGMLTPFGNPQNLYLYSYYSIPNITFVKIMLLPFLISITLITLCCWFFVKKEPLVLHKSEIAPMSKKRMIIYLVLFAFSIAIVFRFIPYYLGLIVIPAFLVVMDRKALKMVDYPLLLTFCAFFVFSGNMARIPAVSQFLGNLINRNALFYGVLSCQVISNVPSAILLSKFTENFAQLLVAVNIGGAGTLIASLASLITLKEYTKHQPNRVLSYVGLYSVCNFSILIVLFIIMTFVF